MNVRAATVGDVNGIQRVATAAWHAAHGSIVGEAAVEEFLDEYYSTEQLRSHAADESRPFFVAEDGDVVGYASVRARDEPGWFGLGSLYVHPDRWHEGIGTALLERAVTEAVERGGTGLRLAVMAENEQAIRFYESRGFDRVEEGYDDRLDVERYVYARDL